MSPALFALGLALLATTAARRRLDAAPPLVPRLRPGRVRARRRRGGRALAAALARRGGLARGLPRGPGRPARRGALGLEPSGTPAAAAAEGRVGRREAPPARRRARRRRRALGALRARDRRGHAAEQLRLDDVPARAGGGVARARRPPLDRGPAHRTAERVPAELRVRAPVHARPARRRRGRRAAAARCAPRDRRRRRRERPAARLRPCRRRVRGAAHGDARRGRPPVDEHTERPGDRVARRRRRVLRALAALRGAVPRRCVDRAGAGHEAHGLGGPPRARAARGCLAPAAADRPRRCGGRDRDRALRGSDRRAQPRAHGLGARSRRGAGHLPVEADGPRRRLGGSADRLSLRRLHRVPDRPKRAREGRGRRRALLRAPRDRPQPTGVRWVALHVRRSTCVRTKTTRSSDRSGSCSCSRSRSSSQWRGRCDGRMRHTLRTRSRFPCRCWRSRSRSASPTKGAT